MDRHRPLLPGRLHRPLDQRKHQGAYTRSKKTKITQYRPYPTLGPAGPWPCSLAGLCNLLNTPNSIHNCIRNSPHNQQPEMSSGILGPTARLQEPALPSSRSALTPGFGFTCQWMGNSPRVFGTLTLLTSQPALAPGSPRIPQPATL